MPTAILATKLYIPPLRPDHILRTRLHQRLSHGLHHKLTLISAPAGFGKTTLVSSWVGSLQVDIEENNGNNPPDGNRATIDLNPKSPHQVAWLSLDAGDNDPYRFLAYMVAAIQTVAPAVGQDIIEVLQPPQPPPLESILTALINDIAVTSASFILVLDDYHIIDAPPVDRALTYFIEHLPPQIHLLITTREDPSLPLARLRARGQLSELRAADLRFTTDEAADFLGQVVGIALSVAEINALENRTEGWIAGLQMAAISMQGHQNIGDFIDSFTGSHHFIMDYLVEEVLHQQPDDVQEFLLYTSILERFCGPLCDAVLQTDSGICQETLWSIAHANLFLIPLDNERRWYRYHHLFADLLQQRLQRHLTLATSHTSDAPNMAELHRRASVWFEENGLEIEAFQHAVAANDVSRAANLAEGRGMPLLFRGAVSPVLKWLESLPQSELNARPSLWVMYASALIFVGRIPQVEPTLQLAEAALRHVEENDKTRDDTGHIATIRATMAIPRLDAETILAQSQRALSYLHVDNLPVRTATTWTLGFAHQILGDRVAAKAAYREAMANSKRLGHFIIQIASATGMGNMLEGDNELHLAAETYQQVLHTTGRWPTPASSETHLGLARIFYQWNDLDVAEKHAQKSVRLAEQIEGFMTQVTATLKLARLRLARGDIDGAAAFVGKAEHLVHQQDAAYLLPEVASMQARILLRQGKGNAAAQRIEPYDLPFVQARIWLVQGDAAAALTLLSSLHQKAVAKQWRDEQLTAAILLALAYHSCAETTKAILLLKEALMLAEPNGIVRIFVDEGPPVVRLLQEAANRGEKSDYIQKLLAAFMADNISAVTANDGVVSDDATSADSTSVYAPSMRTHISSQLPLEPLSPREIEVLALVAQGCSNREISEQLVVALDTVKGHNRRIFGKLQVQRRTEAVARARELGILAR